MMLPARIIPDLSGSKHSGGLARVVFQEPAEPLTTLYRAFALCILAARRKKPHIALALMIPLVMKMPHIGPDIAKLSFGATVRRARGAMT
jgi:hypothetical protein